MSLHYEGEHLFTAAQPDGSGEKRRFVVYYSVDSTSHTEARVSLGVCPSLTAF